MIDTTSNSFARRARLSTAAIALAVSLTVVAIAAVLYSWGSASLSEYQLENPIRQNGSSAR
jgi:hypothetical protein